MSGSLRVLTPEEIGIVAGGSLDPSLDPNWVPGGGYINAPVFSTTYWTSSSTGSNYYAYSDWAHKGEYGDFSSTNAFLQAIPYIYVPPEGTNAPTVTFVDSNSSALVNASAIPNGIYETETGDILVKASYVDDPNWLNYSSLACYMTSIQTSAMADWALQCALDQLNEAIENFDIEPNVDRNFLNNEEGGIRTSGYWPNDANSGVTIGGGVDLAGRTEAELRGWGVPQSVIDILKPYFHYQGSAAQSYLSSHPLTLTQAQANDLTTRAQDAFTRIVATNYNNDSGGNFYSLPSGAQTAIVSVAYQYGPNLGAPDVTPAFWSQVTSGNWAAAVANLNNFGDAYDSRRDREAALIAADLNAGRLASGQVG